MRRALLTLALLVVCCSIAPLAGPPPKPTLTPADIDAIAQIVMLEDTRKFDEAALSGLLKSSTAEVRRRAVIAVGRIVNPGGRALLQSMRTDRDPVIVAAVAFATGQLKAAADVESVGWLGGLLASSVTPAAVQHEAACALGKIRTPESRAALNQYLLSAANPPASVVGEALLSLGRFTLPIDVAPILRWTTSKNAEIRWRAAWALFRAGEPSAIEPLLRLSRDSSPDVRFWAVRGLKATVVTKAGLDLAATSARLREALGDPDRRVKTDALGALLGYDDDKSLDAALSLMESEDTWLSITVLEALANARFQSRGESLAPRLLALTAEGKPTAVRIRALSALRLFKPDAAVEPAAALLKVNSTTARSTAIQALRNGGDAGAAKLATLAADPATAALIPPPAPARGAGGGGGGGRQAAAPLQARPLDEYRKLVEKFIVPAYNGAAAPVVVLDTPKGTIEVELYPGDAPFGVEHMLRVIADGSIVGTEFTRVVPNFVAQQATIRGASLLRDEVNQHGLTRGNLSWASGGLDTGRPGYTLGNTPQPHNEGDFTALGRVIKGMDVVDRLELGDGITGARIRK